MTSETAPVDPQPVPPVAPAAPPAPDADAMKEILTAAKQTLDWKIANREMALTLGNRRVLFQKWGMRNHLALGGKVHALFERVKTLAPGADVANAGTELIASILSLLADDIIDILVRSTVNTFQSHADGYAFFDENLTLDDVFSAGVLVYDQNFGGLDEVSGKQARGMERFAAKLQSLVKARSA